MAANPALSFADILAAESIYVMPATDKEVQAALTSFGADFIKKKGDANIAMRADFLAGLALLYTHHHDAGPLATVLTIVQHQTLAKALGLDFAAHGTDASRPVLLARRIVSRQVPGGTPKKRKLAQDGAGSQIRKPGDGGAPPDSANDGKGQQSSKKPKTAKKPKTSSGSDASAATSSGSEADASSPGPTVVERMPDELGFGPAFDSLVATACARKWLSTSTLEDAIPPTYLPRLFRGKAWNEKQRATYNKMIDKQPTSKPALRRREDPTRVASPHRLKFSFSPDDGLELDADHLRFVCADSSSSAIAPPWSPISAKRPGTQGLLDALPSCPPPQHPCLAQIKDLRCRKCRLNHSFQMHQSARESGHYLWSAYQHSEMLPSSPASDELAPSSLGIVVGVV